MRMRKKPNLVPRMEACGQYWIKEPERLKGKWRSLKPDAVRLRLELGCGKGRFTAETAAQHPEDLYVAVERAADAMVVAMERCRALGLTNVFFIDGDAAELDHCFANDEVDLLYINFCDPWPSVKHSRRRLTHEGFLRSYRKVLREGGEIRFKTDNRALFEWSLFQFPKAGYELSQVTRDLHANGVQGVMTDYEEKFYRLGTPINRCVGTKVKLPDVPVEESLNRALDGLECVWDELPPLPEQTGRYGRALKLSLLENGMERAGLELVEDCPRERTLWVGAFTVEPEARRPGWDVRLAQALARAAAAGGFHAVRLSCPEGENGDHAFWLEQGYGDLPSRQGQEDGQVMMELRV